MSVYNFVTLTTVSLRASGAFSSCPCGFYTSYHGSQFARSSFFCHPLGISRLNPFQRSRKHAGSYSMVYGGGGRGAGSRWGGGRNSPPISDRLLSVLPYLVPLLDALSFGRFVFRRVPLATTFILKPLLPVYQVYRGVPLLAFGLFIALYLLVARNSNISRFIRFNTQQALVLDIALIFPQLFAGLRLGETIPQSVVEVCSTSVFYAMIFAVGYAVISNMRGQLPDQIPAVSATVDAQIGPY